MWSPPKKLDVHCSCSLLTVDSQYELRLPHPLLYDTGPTRLVHAYHVYVRFRPGGPGVDQWEDIVEGLRNCVLSRHDDLQDSAIEFALLRENGNISAWYPPRLDKDKLVAFFEGADSDDSDSATEYGEDRSESPEAQTPRPERKSSATSDGTATLPVLRVNAPEEMVAPRNL